MNDRGAQFDAITFEETGQISIGRMMLGVMLAAMFLAEESRIVLVALTYFLYPIVLVWLVVTKRSARLVRDRPVLWRLAWLGVAGVMTGWPLLFLIPNIPDDMPFRHPVVALAKVIVFAPVAAAAIVSWLLIAFPRPDRRPS